MRSLLQTYLCAILLLAAPSIKAIHESDVGVVDWHKFLVGVPLVAAPVTAPSFSSVSDGKTIDRDIIFTATANNVLAALNPKDGSVGMCYIESSCLSKHLETVWRYVFEADERIVGYYPHSNCEASFSFQPTVMFFLRSAQFW